MNTLVNFTRNELAEIKVRANHQETVSRSEILQKAYHNLAKAAIALHALLTEAE